MNINKSWYKKPKNMPKHESAGGVITRITGSTILIAFIHEHDKKYFVLPKGHIEKNETAKEAAIREIGEETGISDLKLICKLGVRERQDFYKRSWKKTHYFLFLTEQVDGKPSDPKHIHHPGWFSKDKLPHIFWPEQKEIVKLGIKKLSKLPKTKPNLYQGKKVLIFGLGINQGGLGAAKFFIKQGAEVRITDIKTAQQLKPSIDELKKYKGVEYSLGEHKYQDIDWADLIIKNPGVKPDNPFIKYARKKKKQVEMDLGILFQFISPQQVIGVTGTKGKSTTASLIYEVLKNISKKVLFAGNIGKSVFDLIPQIDDQTIIVLEISSFQLEGLEPHHISPKYAVITNILPDHLNYYKTMQKYIESKRLIAKHQKSQDFLLINRFDKVTNTPNFLADLKGKLIYFSPDDLPKDFIPTLPGKHNLANYATALKIATLFGIREDKALKVMNKFKGVEFRLQLIKNWQGVKIYNDSAATGPDAAIQALQTFPDNILITGGVNKKLPYEGYAKAVDDLCRKVYFLEGDATDEIVSLMKNKVKIQGIYNSLEEILQKIKPTLKPGDVILFSPAAASFNLFQNEFDRGRKFNEAVKRVFG